MLLNGHAEYLMGLYGYTFFLVEYLLSWFKRVKGDIKAMQNQNHGLKIG